MKTLIGYCRVSTREQGNSKIGLQVQQKAIREFAQVNGYELLEVFEEVASGGLGIEHRHELRKALAQARKHKATVIVNKLDRLSRQVAFIAAMMQEGVPFVVAELGDDVDNFMLHIYAAVAEKERQVIRNRVSTALQVVKENIKRDGYHISKRGNKVTQLGNLATLDLSGSKGRDQVKQLADDFALRLKPTIERMRDKKMTLQAIAKELNDTGVPTARGGTWTATSVSNLIRRWGIIPKE